MGQWAGLLDENGMPICNLPQLLSMSAPEVRYEPSSLTLSLRIRSASGVVHQVVDELIADGFGVDTEGALVPVTDRARFIMLERPGNTPDVRRVFRVVSATLAGGAEGPSTLQVAGVELLDMLSGIPCPSVLESWTGHWILADRDWAGPWSGSRLIQDIKFATVATGFTESGPAEATIRQLITDSLGTVFLAAGLAGDPPIVVDMTPSGRPSPTVVIRRTDESIWSTVAAHAAAAGVRISAHMWLPGDTWGPPGLSKPTVVVMVEQEVDE